MVIVLVGALALLIVVTIVAVLTLAPSDRPVADGPLQPATSVARRSADDPAVADDQGGPGSSGSPSPAAAPSTPPPAGTDTDPAGGPQPRPSTPGGSPAPAAAPGAGPSTTAGPPGGGAGAAGGGGADGSDPATGAPGGTVGGGASPPQGSQTGSLPQIPVAPPAPTGASAPAAPPAASAGPVEVNAVPGQSTAVLRWSVAGPAADLAGFRVVWTGGGRTIDQQVGPEARRVQVDGLSPGTSYAVAITPIGRDGRLDPGAAQTIGVTTLPGSVPPPAAPADLAVAAGPGSLTVSWTADTADLGTTQFYVSWGCCSGSGFLGGSSVDRDVRSFTITGLATGVNHTVEVQALGPNLDADLSTRRSVSGTPA